MEDIFSRENNVVVQAEDKLSNRAFATCSNEQDYRSLLDEYKLLLRQAMRLVKLSDIMQLELKTISDKLELVSRVDVLTDIYNRRFFNEAYLKEWKHAVRTCTPLSILMIDIDDFKSYNDTYGHLAGDDCLHKVAQRVKECAKRPRDVIARFGGEEFVLVLPETGLEGAVVVAQSVLTGIRDLAISHQSSPFGGKLTVSIGVASCVPDASINLETLVNSADTAMYVAKNEGKNCIRVSCI